MDAKGEVNHHDESLKIVISHEDGYEATAIAAVAGIMQQLDGSMEEPGVIVSESRSKQPIHYAMHIKEHISSQWSAWFEGLTIVNLDNDGSILSGPVIDQSALHGLLAKVRDLNLTLISVNQIGPPQTNTTPVDEA